MHCCIVCGYAAKYPSYLARHMLRHSCERVVICDICGQGFRNISERNMHRRTHDASLHTCRLCSFKTCLKKVLDRHMLVHEEEKQIQCPQCSYRCRRRMDLNKHSVAMHSGKPRRKRHEEAACTLLSEIGIIYEREVVVRFPCPAERKYARVDLLWRTSFGSVVFEVDEYAHRGSRYSVQYECQRMALIHRTISDNLGGSLHIIRYNPHPIRGKPAPTTQDREGQIRSALAHTPSSAGLTITYLFYHTTGEGYPEISLRPGYSLKQHIRIQNAARCES